MKAGRYLAVGLLVAAVFCHSDAGSDTAFSLLRALPERHFFFVEPDELAPGAPSLAHEQVLYQIERARYRIEAYVYGLDDPDLIAALTRASARGVDVSLVGSQDQDYSGIDRTGLVLQLRDRTGLQHMKAILIDQRVFIAGTGNFTRSGFFHNDNVFFALPVDAETAQQLSRSLASEEGLLEPVRLPFAGRMLCGPRDGRQIQRTILRAILDARSSIQFMMFSHTDPLITAALLIQARRGVRIEAIYDDAGNNGRFTSGSEAEQLNGELGLNLGARVYLEGNRSVFERHGQLHGGHLHHKTLIVDGRRVLTGSYNWSLSARDRNRETFFEFQDPRVARIFVNAFEKARARARPMPRSPLNPDRPYTIQPNDAHSVRLAGESQANARLSLFLGDGICFRALHFGLLPEVPGGLVHFEDAATASAGPHDLPLLASESATAWLSPGGGWSNANRGVSDCGLPRVVQAAAVRSVSLAEGWIWFREPRSFDSFYSVGPDGATGPEPLSAIAPDFYRFAPQTIGDRLLFFLGPQSGETSGACVQSGAALDPTIRDLRAALLMDGGPPLPCVANE